MQQNYSAAGQRQANSTEDQLPTKFFHNLSDALHDTLLYNLNCPPAPTSLKDFPAAEEEELPLDMDPLHGCEITVRGSHLCPDGKEFYVRNVYPPIQELQPRVLFVVVIFVLCFIVGVCGNSSILTIIRGILSDRKSSRSSMRRSSDNAILYIAALCVVDFLMSLSLPPAILDSIIGFWMFGTTICKLHHVCGSVGRIVSTFLITAMSFDRFVAVCHPYKKAYRSRKFVLYTIAALWTIAFLLLLPMLTYAKANEILLHQIRQKDVDMGVENLTRVRVFKCSDMMPPLVFYWFTSSTFILGYLVPLLLIVFFNSRLLRKLYRHTKQLRSGIPLRRISIYTTLIAVLYFVCWTPYWCSVLYAIYMSLFSDGHSESTSDLLLFIIYCVHLLPYFGSATNWILYGLLNTQLQMRQQTEGHDDYCTTTALNAGGQSMTNTNTNNYGGDNKMIGLRNGRNKTSVCTVTPPTTNINYEEKGSNNNSPCYNGTRTDLLMPSLPLLRPTENCVEILKTTEIAPFNSGGDYAIEDERDSDQKL